MEFLCCARPPLCHVHFHNSSDPAWDEQQRICMCAEDLPHLVAAAVLAHQKALSWRAWTAWLRYVEHRRERWCGRCIFLIEILNAQRILHALQHLTRLGVLLLLMHLGKGADGA